MKVVDKQLMHLPFSVSTTTTVKAIAVKDGMTDSGIATAIYAIERPVQVALPVITPAADTYTSAQSVTLTCATAGTPTIRYTIDGSTPNAGSTQYTGPFTVSTTTTIKAYATKVGMTDSPVASVTLTIQTVDSGTHQPGEQKTIDLGGGVFMNFRWCPAGSFQMGSPDTEPGRWSGEGPVHTVTLTKGYWMAETECTQAQWQAVTGNNPSFFQGDPGDDVRPVEQVSWTDIAGTDGTGGFMGVVNGKGLGVGTFRLPTEAEWEYACRAGTTDAYYWGAAWDDAKGWYSGNSGMTTHPVKTKSWNTWNLYDMSGNVWEWCLDWFGPYPSGSVTDPQGPASGSHRAIRGGSWNDDAGDCRSAFRCYDYPSNRCYVSGFRPLLAPGQ